MYTNDSTLYPYFESLMKDFKYKFRVFMKMKIEPRLERQKGTIYYFRL